MGSVKEESVGSTEPAKADPDSLKAENGLKHPLLPKTPRRSSSLVPSARATSGTLPAFRLAPDGLGGIRFAAIWVT